MEETEQESGVEDAQTDAETVDGGQPEEEGGAQEETEASSEGSAEGQLYEDNFAVDEDAVVAFGEKIQEAVAAKDMEALADLTAFPSMWGFRIRMGSWRRERISWPWELSRCSRMSWYPP